MTTMTTDTPKGTKKKPAAAETPRVVEETARDRTLPCKLTNDEVVRKADEITTLHATSNDLESRKKKAADEFKTQIEHTEGEIAKRVSEIRRRSEDRDVACTKISDFDQGIIFVRRDDTREIVETRPMTEEERQPKLFSITGGGKEKGAGKPVEKAGVRAAVDPRETGNRLAHKRRRDAAGVLNPYRVLAEELAGLAATAVLRVEDELVGSSTVAAGLAKCVRAALARDEEACLAQLEAVARRLGGAS